MKVSEAFPNRFMRLEDVADGPKTLTISAAELDETYGKINLHFEETEQILSLNQTNRKTLQKELGDEMDDWIAHRIVVYAGEVLFNNQMQPGIRVKLAKGKPAAAKPDNGNAYAQAKGKSAKPDDLNDKIPW